MAEKAERRKKKRYESVVKLGEHGNPVAVIKDFPTKKEAESYIIEKVTAFGSYAIITTYK